jgi:hypothetical protein
LRKKTQTEMLACSLLGASEVNSGELAQASWKCLRCDCRCLGDDLLVAPSPDEAVVVREFEEPTTTHVYDLNDQELDPTRLRCPNCGSAELQII